MRLFLQHYSCYRAVFQLQDRGPARGQQKGFSRDMMSLPSDAGTRSATSPQKYFASSQYGSDCVTLLEGFPSRIYLFRFPCLAPMLLLLVFNSAKISKINSSVGACTICCNFFSFFNHFLKVVYPYFTPSFQELSTQGSLRCNKLRTYIIGETD